MTDCNILLSNVYVRTKYQKVNIFFLFDFYDFDKSIYIDEEVEKD